ncbi:DUF4232 domain-containing protein [Pseudonocardia sp. McavD-2-B]|uniref:DUF4232 domain-containing protein n=1 Tax=Pseudonocardia sp. McavD-2-B TaxID=2954499 RepID=UPI002096F7D9|nr:DUF4232 domain-containing protein [Pseudonocardia sp. McavD-2-B]MCO7193195.1 DUF4232 domain-containing protein [Pseudonocardia sp. McavD-2-B]
MTNHRTPLLIGLLSAGLLVAGCGGGAAPSEAPAALSTAPTTAAQQPTGETSSSEAGEVARCTSSTVQASVGTTLGDNQKDTTIVWRNTSDAPCTMTGFGGVDLRGPDDPQFGPSYSLPRAQEEPTAVVVKPGGTAHTVITWLPGDSWTPTDIVVTAPDETTSTTLKWDQGPVSRQDGATRPGTYIHPVAPGSV